MGAQTQARSLCKKRNRKCKVGSFLRNFSLKLFFSTIKTTDLSSSTDRTRTRAQHHAQPAVHARLAPHRRDLRSCIRPSPLWPLCSYDAPFNRRSIPTTRLPCTDALIQVRLQFSCACARVLVVRGAFRRCSCAFPLCRPRFISCCCVVRWRFMLSWRVCAVVLCCRVFLLPSCGAVVWFRAVVWCCRLVWFRFVPSCRFVPSFSCHGFVWCCRAFLFPSFSAVVSCRRVVSCSCVVWCRRFVSCRGFVRCCPFVPSCRFVPSCLFVPSCRFVLFCPMVSSFRFVPWFCAVLSCVSVAVVWCCRFVPSCHFVLLCRVVPSFRSCRGFVWCCRVFAVVSFCAVVCVLSCCRAVLTRVSVVRRAVLSCVSCVSVVPSCGAVVSLRARAVPVPCLR